MIKVGIHGYGTIGKRVADAVYEQNDMGVIGVTKTKPNFEADLALKKGLHLYAGVPEHKKAFKEAGLNIKGTIDDLVKDADVIVDCTPKKIGANNKEELYLPTKTNAIFEGGEKSSVADISFVAQCNYEQALGKKYVRCVSCNTTGLSRTLGAISSSYGIGKVRVFLVRRSVDPGNSSKGPINAIIPDPIAVPSHHGPDVNTILPDLNIISSAVKVPTTLMHLHSLMIELNEDVKEDQVIDLLSKTPRVRLINSKNGLTSTAEVIEYARDLKRPRYDLYETMIWEDSIQIKDKELYLFQAIHQEAIVVPENIDAIRAMFELEKDPLNSIKKTDKSLGI